MRLLAEQLLHQLLDLRHTCLTANQHHLVDLRRIHARILHRLLARPNRLLQQIIHQRLQLRARQLAHQVLRPARVCSNERQIDLRLLRRRQLDLRALGRVLQPLQRHLVALRVQVKPGLRLELRNQPVHNPLVKIVAAQVRIAVGRLHLDHAFADLKNRDIERTAAEVVNRNRLVLLLIQPIRQRGRRRLVHNALHIQPGNLARVFRRLPLSIIEVSRNCNHGLVHRAAQIILCSLLQLLQNHRRDLRRRVLLALRHDRDMVALLHNLVGHHLHLVVHFVVATAHKPLDRIDRVLRVRNRLPFGHLTNQPLPALRKRNHRRRSPPTLFVRNHLRLAAFHHGHARVRRSQVNSNNLSHP